MSAFAVVLALLLEQWRPAPQFAGARVDRVIDELAHRLDGGRGWHAWLAWSTFALVAAVSTLLAGRLLGAALGLLEAAFIVGVLYLTIGFRVFSRRFSAVRDGLAARRLDLAGAALAAWQGAPLAASGGEMPATTPETIAHQAIERGVDEAARWLFGGVFWFALLPGASGPVLYRAADRLATRWGRTAARSEHPGFCAVASSALTLLDALPARFAAAAFALVGNFTGAAEGWQGAVRERRGDARSAMVAAALGALGMEAGAPVAAVTRAQRDAANEHYDGAGWDADSYAIAVGQMDGAAALVWRSLLVWLAAVALLAFAF